MELSIIIPVYNVEKYLSKCLASVVDTVWGNIDYEIIVVDDESPDSSLKIADEYQKNHSHIKIFTQKNKGLGGARNTGIENAVGDYLFFLDSDDYLVHDNLPVLLNQAVSNKVDILEFSAETVDEEYIFLQNIFPVRETTVVSGQDYFARLHPANSVCNKLYRREFILEHSIRFMENVYVEDAPFNVEAFIKAEKVTSFPLIPVAFTQNLSSITRKKRMGKQMEKFISDSIEVTKKIAGFGKLENLTTEAQNAVQQKTAFFVSGILLMILKADKKWSEKLIDIGILQKASLYPMKFKSGSLIRDIFLFFGNKRYILKIIQIIFKTWRKP